MFLLRTPHKLLLPRQQIADWGCNLGKVGDKPVVVVSKAKELLHPFDVLGGFPACYCYNLVLIHSKFPRANCVAQVLHPFLAKVTFLQLSMNFVLPQASKHLPEVLLMLFSISIGIH